MSSVNASVSLESHDRSPSPIQESIVGANHAAVIDSQNLSSALAPNKTAAENANSTKVKAKSIGNYILGKTLGEGTFGKVKLATHILTGEKVAIKILEKDRIIDVSDVERVAREIYILKFIRHPNIIQLYEIIETPKLLFLVTEYVSGGELFDYIVAKQRVEEREASKFFHQIIAGVEYIHKLKIVHRDLKPENLLLDYNNNIKIVDFGLSNTYNENELLKTACGSPCYAAPEMIGGKKYNGLQVDIWSCGVILFAIVCGYLPFEDSNTAVLYKKILSGDYTIPKFVSEEAKDLIKNILTTDPVKRYTIDDIRKHPWMNQIELPKISEGIIVGYHQIPVDLDILKQLEQYGFDNDNAQKCLDANKNNHVTTAYYLLLRKFHQSGGRSAADINAENFDESLLMPKPNQPKAVTCYSVDSGHESEKENDRKVDDKDRTRKKSTDQSFMYTEASFKQKQSREIAKIYGSILDSSSRDRTQSGNHSSKGSRVLKEASNLDVSNDNKRRSLTSKRGSSPHRAEFRDDKLTQKGVDTKETMGASGNASKQNQFFNKSFNNTVLRDKLREIYKTGGEQPARARSRNARRESRENVSGYVNQSMNHELLNDSFKADVKDVNSSFRHQLQPKLQVSVGKNSRSNSKKPAFISIQTTPKKEKRVVHHLDEKPNPNISYDVKYSSNANTAHTVNSTKNPHQTRTSSQSPSRFNAMIPKEPIYTKPRDSSMNVYRTRANSRKNSTRMGVQLTNGRAWRPTTNNLPVRERGSSIGMAEESFSKGGYATNDVNSTFNVGHASFALNSSYQKGGHDMSFDYSSHQPKSYLNALSKRVSYGGPGDAVGKKPKNAPYSPINIHKKNLQSILNKSGAVKC